MRNYADSKLSLSEVFEQWIENEDITDIPRDAICNILKEFTGQEVAAILYRFRERLTYSQIELRLGVTKERALQILSKALRKLRYRSGGVVRKIDNNRLEVGDI